MESGNDKLLPDDSNVAVPSISTAKAVGPKRARSKEEEQPLSTKFLKVCEDALQEKGDVYDDVGHVVAHTLRNLNSNINRIRLHSNIMNSIWKMQVQEESEVNGTSIIVDLNYLE